MHHPVIGITTSFNAGEQRLDHAYVKAVEQAGGIPLILPMLKTRAATELTVERIDGLIITGGPAIVDRLIGPLPDDIQETDPVRITSDKWVLASFLRQRLPVLGICYGMQLINAEFGGSIYADVERQLDGVSTHSKTRGGTTHPVGLQPNTRLRSILDAESVVTNTRHVQAVAELGAGLRINAIAGDGVVEGLENEDGTLLAVQFHPEQMGAVGLPLFADLVERARQAAKRHV